MIQIYVSKSVTIWPYRKNIKKIMPKMSEAHGSKKNLYEVITPNRQRQVACWYERMCLKTTRTPSENVAVVQAHLDLNLDLNPTGAVGKVVL